MLNSSVLILCKRNQDSVYDQEIKNSSQNPNGHIQKATIIIPHLSKGFSSAF